MPGTHQRATTAAERRVLTWPTSASEQDPEMPGRMVVNLAPGEAVYYHSSMFHRGVYPRSASSAPNRPCTQLSHRSEIHESSLCFLLGHRLFASA